MTQEETEKVFKTKRCSLASLCSHIQMGQDYMHTSCRDKKRKERKRIISGFGWRGGKGPFLHSLTVRNINKGCRFDNPSSR